MNCQELQEELTVQEVILDSLQGETFEGVELDREEARAEISRLKRALKALRKVKKDEQGTDMMLLDGRRVTPQRGMGSDVPATPGKHMFSSIRACGCLLMLSSNFLESSDITAW
ncbi:hypothetical protein HDV63DRAFT_293508 [Trichoderma sp. SZMC 28014]